MNLSAVNKNILTSNIPKFNFLKMDGGLLICPTCTNLYTVKWLDELKNTGILEQPAQLQNPANVDSRDYTFETRKFLSTTLYYISEAVSNKIRLEEIVKAMKDEVSFDKVDQAVTDSLIDRAAKLYTFSNSA